MKIIITESQYDKAIDKYMTYKLEPHEERFSKRYHDSIFWVKGGEVIAQINNKLDLFWLHEDIWRSISMMRPMSGLEIQHSIKKWLEEHYGITDLSPRIAIGYETRVWDKIKFE